MMCRSFFLFFFCFISWHSHSMNKGSNDPARGIILSSLVNKAATLIAGHQLPSKESEHISTVHDKIKPHKCNQCPKSFGYKHHLTQHIDDVHNQEKPHECATCPKISSSENSKKYHEIVCELEEPFINVVD